MAADVDHVVDAAHDPKIAVFISPRAIAGKIDALDLRPVLLLVTLVIAPNRSQHRRPGTCDYQITTLAGAHCLPLASHHVNFNSRKRLCGRAGLCWRGARQWRDHDRAGLGLPPR